MGCGVSKESASEVLGNTVTQNGKAHDKSQNGNAAAKNGKNILIVGCSSIL